MNLEKSHKRIAKQVRKGFQGYPLISITYHGPSDSLATKVVVGFTAEEDAEMMTETFSTQTNIREDVAVQTTIIKIIDRSGAKSVSMDDGVQPL
ncbi:MAG: hypothetical protein CME36_16770 [unclassified Hahellaceae]|nr:hypothetical protein [Hahellaceae bacterium]|tara:strand:+ start:86709 stop:86990 length:282 start_codon:yes stop_codon:yes gene_type:complete